MIHFVFDRTGTFAKWKLGFHTFFVLWFCVVKIQFMRSFSSIITINKWRRPLYIMELPVKCNSFSFYRSFQTNKKKTFSFCLFKEQKTKFFYHLKINGNSLMNAWIMEKNDRMLKKTSQVPLCWINGESFFSSEIFESIELLLFSYQIDTFVLQ